MLQRLLSAALLIAALAVTGFFVYTARHELLAAIRNTSLLFVALLYAATLTQNIVLWLLFHVSIAAQRDYELTSRMYFGGQLAKYVPGKIWAVVYQASVRTESMPVGTIVQGNIVVYIQAVLCAVVASAILIVQQFSLAAAAAILVAGGIAASWLMSSDHLYRIVQRISAFSSRTELTANVATADISVAVRLLIYATVLVSYVLAYVFLIYAFYDFDVPQVLRMAAYLGIAWLVGVVVAVTPSGLGVREAAFVGIGYLTGEASVEVFAGIAVVARALQIILDVISAFAVPAAVRFLLRMRPQQRST